MATVKLGDIAIEAKSSNKGDKTGIRIVGLEHLTPSNVTLSSWSEDTENMFTKEFSKGDVLFGRRRAYLKKAAVAPFDGICSGDITVIRAVEDKVDPDLLPFIIQNDFLFEFAVGKSAGSLSPRVKWTHLKEFAIELPSMPEQSKLAETLWSINETKNAYKDLINKTDELVKSQFIEMFGDPLSNCHYETKTIGEVGEVMTGTTPSMKKEEYYDSDDILFIKPGDIPENTISRINTAENHISDKARKAARIFPEGSVLVTCIGTIGKIGVAEFESSCNQQINVIVPYSNINSLFLAYNLLIIRNVIQDAANTPVVPILNKTEFSKLKVMVPPYEQQCEFAILAQQSDKSKFALQEAIKDLDALSKKIIAENLIPAGKE